MAKSTRTSISVPEDLKTRMDAVGGPVNWSSIACAAFELKLNEIESKKAIQTMNDVIMRLRASRRGSDATLHQEGREAGEHWAKSTAGVDELERLALYQETYANNWLNIFASEGTAYSYGEVIFFVICQELAGNRKAAEDFWKSVTDDYRRKMEQGEFVRGFAEGAIELWRQVRSQI